MKPSQQATKKNFVQPVTGRFHGGIHPAENKELSNSMPIGIVPLFKELIIPLKQHAGHTSQPIVKLDEQVNKGQLIATCHQSIGANIHSPADAIVKSIENRFIGHASGLEEPAIILQTEASQPSESYSQVDDWKNQSPEDLLKQVKQAGIVGLGGATFPTDIKLSSSQESTTSINTLIVNAMECEPYITCDDRMLREMPDEVIQGAVICATITQAKEIIFAIENNKPEAIESLNIAINFYQSNNPNSEIIFKINVAPTKYPSGGEKQTIELVLGKQLPKGQRPASMGVLVQNVATLQAIYACIVKKQVLANRLVTITGDLVSQPGNYWIPFGTQLKDLINFFDISKEACQQAILGGPLMGNKITNFSVPVTKSTNCIIFNSAQTDQKSWLLEPVQHQACIRCGDCEKVCPAELLPQQLYWYSQSEQWASLEKQGLFDCIDCGACAYVCPSEIPLVHYFRFGKSNITQNQQKKRLSDKAKQRFEFKEFRLQRNKTERDLKRKEHAKKITTSNNEQKDPQTDKQTAIKQALERVKQKKNQATKSNSEGHK